MSLLELILTKKIFKAINEIFRYIKPRSSQLTKKSLKDKISMRFLGLKTKSDIAIKSKAIKILLKNIAQL